MVFGNSTIPVIGCKYTRLKKRKNVKSNHKFHKPDDMSIIWILLSTFGKHAARILPVPDDIVIECLIVILWKSTMINHYSACFWIGNQNSYLAKQSWSFWGILLKEWHLRVFSILIAKQKNTCGKNTCEAFHFCLTPASKTTSSIDSNSDVGTSKM